MTDIQVGDWVELCEEATYARGGLRQFDGDGRQILIQGEVKRINGSLVNICRHGAVMLKGGSYPMVEWVNRSDIAGVVQPGLVLSKARKYEQFWD